MNGVDNPGAWPKHRVVAWGLAALAHIVGLAAFLLYVPPDKPVEPATVPISMVAPPAPPEPPQEKIEPVQIKPIERPRPIFHPLAQLKPLPLNPAYMQPVPIPSSPPPQPPPAPTQAPLATGPHENLPPTYISKLFDHLSRYRRYPRAARSAREQGVAELRFTMDRQGHVLAYRIERSSGYADLDAEVLAMIQRAQPLPELPADMPDTVEVIIPIQFSLR